MDTATPLCVVGLTKKAGAYVFVVGTLRYRFKLDDPSKAASVLGSTAAAAHFQESLGLGGFEGGRLLEQTLKYLVGRWTYAQVSRAVLAQPEADKSKHQCFAGHPEQTAAAALQNKVATLRPRCGGILSAQPFGWVR